MSMDSPQLSFDDLEQRLRFKPLWELGIKGRGMTAAVLDTGFSTGKDIDEAVIIEKDFTGEDSARSDEYWHGSVVAKGIHLIAPEAGIANFRVVPANSEFTRESVCEAVRYCIQEFPKYHVLNLSLYFEPEGCTESNPCKLCSIVNEAVSKGIVVVAAAGNLGPGPGTISCPGLAKDALTIVSTWTKNEADWWEDLSRIRKWWWKDFTGEFGKAYGTSFSAAWATGAVCLLKSAFPESRPGDIRNAILRSAFRLTNAPDTTGILQCKEALDLLLNPASFQSAERALYFNAGNKDVQWPGSHFTYMLGFMLSYIRYKMIPEGRLAEAKEKLITIRRWIVPEALPEYLAKADELLLKCE